MFRWPCGQGLRCLGGYLARWLGGHVLSYPGGKVARWSFGQVFGAQVVRWPSS